MASKERKSFRALRGTVDILPEEQGYWRYVRGAAVSVCEGYGYGRIDTPILEDYSLFARGVGEVTDIVEKEMYTITDKGGDTIALRPEATAAVCRAYLEHGLHNRPQPVRLYSVGMAMFRYARPQAGRLRQFHQINVEAIGDADATIDAEVIALCWQLFRVLGLKGLSLQLNSIGDPKCRPGYVEALRGYYSQHEGRLCRDCGSRLGRNPLRLLDCKEPGCQPLIEAAPRSADYLCEECEAHFQALTRYLGLMEVPFVREHRLVRGLDYYTRTVFEVQTSEEGQQNSLGGGGRYDGLIEELGGRPTPGVGFAVGMERVILNLKRQGIEPPALPGTRVFVAYV
ncbi:MAG: histidine--tRNA ligase, partial [Dehalococcoidia bacterium]